MDSHGGTALVEKRAEETRKLKSPDECGRNQDLGSMLINT